MLDNLVPPEESHEHDSGEDDDDHFPDETTGASPGNGETANETVHTVDNFYDPSDDENYLSTDEAEIPISPASNHASRQQREEATTESPTLPSRKNRNESGVADPPVTQSQFNAFAHKPTRQTSV